MEVFLGADQLLMLVIPLMLLFIFKIAFILRLLHAHSWHSQNLDNGVAMAVSITTVAILSNIVTPVAMSFEYH